MKRARKVLSAASFHMGANFRQCTHHSAKKFTCADVAFKWQKRLKTGDKRDLRPHFSARKQHLWLFSKRQELHPDALRAHTRRQGPVARDAKP